MIESISTGMNVNLLEVAVVVPCYRVIPAVMAVLSAIGPEVQRIYCVDDACPEASGRFIEKIAKTNE